MNDQYKILLEKDAIIDVVNQLFISTDNCDWTKVKACFTNDVLFELATDGPGFDRDEDMKNLGEQLILPPWLEPHRPQIEAALPPLEMPHEEM